MGKLQEIKDKAAQMVTENRDKIDKGLDKAAGIVDQKTGHQHSDKIDETAHSVGGKLDRATHSEIGADEPATPPPSTPDAATAVPEARDAAVSPEVMWNSSPAATAEGKRAVPDERTQSS
jgi:hypothetical protein